MDEWILACRTLEAAGVRYVIVGGFGAELHFLHEAGAITTQDMDLLLPLDARQVELALTALCAAGFLLSAGGEPVIPDEVIAQGIVRQRATVRATRGLEAIDVMTQAQELDFEALWAGHQPFVVRGVSVRVAPLHAILRAKHAVGRTKDRLFLEQFREVIAEALEREQKRGRTWRPDA